MIEIMVDLETMSTKSNAAIISIGAVKFDTRIKSEFYEVVALQSSINVGLSVEARTILWWMEQDDESRNEFHKGVHLSHALYKFSAWVGNGDKNIWGNGASFDNVILRNAYDACGLTTPWKFYEDRCYRTIKNLFPEITCDRIGTHHNALDDARTQALHLIKMRSK